MNDIASHVPAPVPSEPNKNAITAQVPPGPQTSPAGAGTTTEGLTTIADLARVGHSWRPMAPPLRGHVVGRTAGDGAGHDQVLAPISGAVLFALWWMFASRVRWADRFVIFAAIFWAAWPWFCWRTHLRALAGFSARHMDS